MDPTPNPDPQKGSSVNARFNTRRIVMFSTAVLALSALACGTFAEGVLPTATPAEPPTPLPLTSLTLRDTCAGAPAEAAAPFSPDDEGVNPVVVFIREDVNASYIERSSFADAFPEEEWLRSFGEYETVELVACLTVTDRQLVEECEYEDDETGEVSLLQTYDATYEIELYEAATGEVVQTGTLFGPADDCPMFAFFDDGEVEIRDGEPTTELLDFLQPFVEP